MESVRSNRRRFTGSKLVRSFFGAAKAGDTPCSAAAGSQVGLIIVNQDQVYPQQKPRVSLLVPERAGKLETFYSLGTENKVDAEATLYISKVRERFQLERVNSERKTFQFQDGLPV